MTNLAKLNDGHRLVQLWPAIARGRGIDAVWRTEGSSKPYAIIEAKASCDPTKSLQALLGEARDKTDATNTTASSPTRHRGGRSGSRGNGGSSAATEAVRQTNGKVTQMSKSWIEGRLQRAVGGAKAESAIKASGYSRHVQFFSIPHAISHAEALIKPVAQQSIPHEFHAAHEVTREWGDGDIEKVVDNRAGLVDKGRKR